MPLLTELKHLDSCFYKYIAPTALAVVDNFSVNQWKRSAGGSPASSKPNNTRTSRPRSEVRRSAEPLLRNLSVDWDFSEKSQTELVHRRGF